MTAVQKSFVSKIPGDQFRFWAATFVSLCTLISNFAWAKGFDFSAQGSYRSYPLSGVLEIESGYGVELYGSSAAPPWYGYVRPRALLSTIGTYNSADGALEVFPISFLGFRAGGEAIQNDDNYSAHDCSTYICKGRFYRTYAEAELTFGFKGVFARGSWRRDRWTLNSPSVGEFIDPTGGISLSASGDSETVYRGLVGYTFSPKWSAMALIRYAESDETRMISRFPHAVVRYTLKDWSLALGGGVFESSLKKQEGAAIALLRWEPRPSVGLK